VVFNAFNHPQVGRAQYERRADRPDRLRAILSQAIAAIDTDGPEVVIFRVNED